MVVPLQEVPTTFLDKGMPRGGLRLRLWFGQSGVFIGVVWVKTWPLHTISSR